MATAPNIIIGLDRKIVLHALIITVAVICLNWRITVCASSVLNNQYHAVRRLQSLRSYKDAQIFRFQIAPEIVRATFRLNASQSEIPINHSLESFSTSASVADDTGFSEPPAIMPPSTTPTPITTTEMAQFWPPIDPPSTAAPPPPSSDRKSPTLASIFNTTILTIYRDKFIQFYRSFLPSACKHPVNVTIHLRWGSLPLFAIKNATTPDRFIVNDTAEQYRIDLRSDGEIVSFNLTNPLPGDWYAAAYIADTDDRISQKGLERECFYRLIASLNLEPFDGDDYDDHNEQSDPNNGDKKRSNRVTILTSSASPLPQSLPIAERSSSSSSSPPQYRQPHYHFDSTNMQVSPPSSSSASSQSPPQPNELLYKFFPSGHDFGAKLIIKNCQYHRGESQPSSVNLRHNHPNPFNNNNNNNNNMQSQYDQNQQIGRGGGYNDQTMMSQNSSSAHCPVMINFRAFALPTVTIRDLSFTCESTNQSTASMTTTSATGNVETNGGRCEIDLPTYVPNAWNYLQITPLFIPSTSLIGGDDTVSGFESSRYAAKQATPIFSSSGLINFTIQLLMGQEAFLYSYFNDQCTQQQQQQQQQQHHHQQQQPPQTYPNVPHQYGAVNSGFNTHSQPHPQPSQHQTIFFNNNNNNNNDNFGIGHGPQANAPFNTLITTAASVVVAPPVPNSVSHIKSEGLLPSGIVAVRNGGGGDSSGGDVRNGAEIEEFDLNTQSAVIVDSSLGVQKNISDTQTKLTAHTMMPTFTTATTTTIGPSKISTTTANKHLPSDNHRQSSSSRSKNEDSIYYVDDAENNDGDRDPEDDEIERELAKSSLSQFMKKRSADPPPAQGGPKGRKSGKGDRKKNEGRRLRTQKNRQKAQKAQEAARQRVGEQCRFDPSKIWNSLDEDERSNMTLVNIVNMTRYQAVESFEFRYRHLDATDLLANRDRNLSETIFVQVDNDRPSLLNFTIIPQYDIGGSMAIDFAISPHTDNRQQNVSAILCLTHNRLPPIVSSSPGIRFDEYCYGHLVSNTSSANFTTDGSAIRSLVVPYPQPGTWYISVVVRCYTEDDTLEDPLVANVDYSGYSCDYTNRTSVLLEIRSSACHNARCQNGGKCKQYVNGGVLYSTCSCRSGWKGLMCNDGTEALSEQRLLLNFLLLTVSNAAFAPAIIVAACRSYFTESAVYLIMAISSALYHACDSDYSQSYCVLNVGFLQFADFYTAVLSFFVTLITLANVSPRCKSFLHLMGAIAIALITQNDRTCLWTFVIPAGVATLLLFICWCTQCCRRTCYPPTKCWIFSVCPAFILMIVGLIIYAFFETQENYAITHSIWHGIIAFALLFAIPSMPSKTATESEDEDDERAHFMSSSSSSGAGSGKGTTTTKSNPETYYELIGEEASHLARSHPPQGVHANSKPLTKTY